MVRKPWKARGLGGRGKAAGGQREAVRNQGAVVSQGWERLGVQADDKMPCEESGGWHAQPAAGGRPWEPRARGALAQPSRSGGVRTGSAIPAGQTCSPLLACRHRRECWPSLWPLPLDSLVSA